MSNDIWIAVFDGEPNPMIPHPNADEVVGTENFISWVRVTAHSLGAGTQREIGLQVVQALRESRGRTE